ncbi:hypothetical protein SAMN05444279_1149 [Ruegeria intermedia]|uniref:HTH cro/C1-type domain-containing protein n=1 Tax=Ruegeria intermedia TaxID=996115 RepID=A0A1M4Y5G1_9RHOB|nr:hypothetical protein [Ruegeria intermedia]SHF00910.1 hypothetical protein SAMN05444279_1149 [Ruegeria intermedia]
MSGNTVPYTWEEIEEQIRLAILAQASILGQFGPSDPTVFQSYLGIDTDTWQADYMDEGQAAAIPLERHQIYHQVKRAYLYAYQLDGFEQASGDDWHETAGLLEGFPQTDFLGEPSPLCPRNDFPLRRVLETYFARWSWHEEGFDLTIRQLSLLANMTIPAVRTSLSKEGFKLEQLRGSDSRRDDGSTARLSADDAIVWLSRRRGFIPNRERNPKTHVSKSAYDLMNDPKIEFPDLLRALIEVRSISFAGLAHEAKCSETWLEKLISGQDAEIDLAALQVIAQIFQVDTPDFVAKGVKYLLQLEER